MLNTSNLCMTHLVGRNFSIPMIQKKGKTIIPSSEDKMDLVTYVKDVDVRITTGSETCVFGLLRSGNAVLKESTDPAAQQMVGDEFFVPPLNWMEREICVPTVTGKNLVLDIKRTDIMLHTANSIYEFSLH